MCGIAGIINLRSSPPDEKILDEMTDSLAHRGPDGRGTVRDERVGLGHRRLAILDLSPLGAQPMSAADGSCSITYNGEIYNFAELRKDLEDLGVVFKSRSDTEVLLEAYVKWGTSVIQKLNGMFAFAIYDRRKNKVVLARDRYGIKPLYYTTVGNQILFASESKSFEKHPSFQRKINKSALGEYFTFQNLFRPHTLLVGVEILPPGTYAEIELNSGVPLRMVKYWDYHFSDSTKISEIEALEQLDFLFNQAIQRQLVADVPIGSYLSGGIDSGAVTAIASRKLPYMNTFTIGFDLSSASGMELAFDERSKAERMSYAFKTEHYEMVLKAGDMERSFKGLVWHLEEPRVGQSYPNFYAARLASKFNKVVLSGTGGDELFGGYPWRYYKAASSLNLNEFLNNYFQYWQRLVPDGDTSAFFRPISADFDPNDSREIFKGVFSDFSAEMRRPEDYVNNSLYFEAKTFLHSLLTVEDKLSMAHSLEARLPFLDNDLVDFAMKMPVRLKLAKLSENIKFNENDLGSKVDSYFSRTQDGKLLLRKVMERYVPQEVTSRNKQGFSAPDASWFRGESMDYVRRVVFEKDSPIYQYVDRKTVHGLVSQHLEGLCNRRLLIWSLLYFDQWCETFL